MQKYSNFQKHNTFILHTIDNNKSIRSALAGKYSINNNCIKEIADTFLALSHHS